MAGMKTSKKISKKISKIMKEGVRKNTKKPVSKSNPRKPVSQKQAIAIAYSMAGKSKKKKGKRHYSSDAVSKARSSMA